MSRKDRIAPFEVMRSGRDQRERSGAHPEAHADDEDSPATQPVVAESQPAVFEPTSSGPLVLRIPKGYEVLAGFILVGLLAMVYWVGYPRGDKDRLTLVRQERESKQEMYNRSALIANGSNGATEKTLQGVDSKTVGDGKEKSGPVAVTPGKYVAGFNYFVLVHYPPKEAGELVEFLGQHGVDAAAIFVNNNRFKVVALEGFLASDLDSQRAREYKQLLRRLGRLWQDSKRGAGDLSDMYPERYDGPSK